MPSMQNVLSIILGGGAGSRLFPLTKERSKPAVPLGGKYRLIDIPISNCLNSNLSRIAVLTQYNSVSLHRHITRTYNFDAFHRGWVQIWAAEQTPRSESWYQGTADAVRKQMLEIKSTRLDYVLILGGDHLYRMDYQEMARYHWETGADVTVAVQPIRAEDAGGLGILHRESSGKITRFVEKPKDPEILKTLVSLDDPERPFLGSMGIYMFSMDVLTQMLEDESSDDFGNHVIPKAIRNKEVYGFLFDGFWEDIGTIRSFYESNLRLAQPNPPFDFHSSQGPIYTRARFLPGSTIYGGAHLNNVLISDGCRIGTGYYSNTIVGLRSEIGNDAHIEDTIVMGSDYYNEQRTRGESEVGIGHGCRIKGAIIDKNVLFGNRVIIQPFERGTNIDGGRWYVRDGIVVIPKKTQLEEGTYIGPEQ